MFLGLDLGTSGLKALLAPLSQDIRIVAHVDEQARALVRHYGDQILDGRPQPLDREMELAPSESWWNACMNTLPPIVPQNGCFEETQGAPFWLDYRRLVGFWEDVFGEGTVALRPYRAAEFASDRVTDEVRESFAITRNLGKPPAAPATSTGLTDFEPVVLASVRRSEEQPAPTSRFGRRRRAESRAPAPADEAAPTDETPDETHAGLPGATSAEVDREPRGEAPPPEPEVQPEPEPESEAEPPADPAPPASAAAEVFAAFNDTVAPADGPSSDDPADGPATPERRRRPTRTPRPPRVRPGLGAGLARYAAGARDLLDRSVRGAPEDRSAPAPVPPTSQPTSQPTSGPAPAARHETSRQASGQEATTDRPRPTDPVGPAEGGARSTSAYDALRAQREAAVPPRPAVLPPDIDFRPRTLARQVTSLLLLVGIALTLLAAWRAYDSRVQTDIGFAAILALFTGIVWAVRAGSVPTRMSLHGGLLEVRTQAGRFLFELTSAHTHLEQVGTPGRPGWKVLVHRRGMHPFEITRGMVDPHEFLDAVRYYRPDL